MTLIVDVTFQYCYYYKEFHSFYVELNCDCCVKKSATSLNVLNDLFTTLKKVHEYLFQSRAQIQANLQKKLCLMILNIKQNLKNKVSHSV